MRFLAIAAAALVLAACSEGPVTPDVADPSFDISDALHGGGNEHFFWLPPMVGNPAGFNGAFDGALSPVVSICDLADCANNLIAEYTTTTGPGSETVRVVPEDEHYIVNWHTDEFDVAPGPTYRISLLVEGTELGYADVELGSTGKDVKNLATDEIIGLKDGRTLPIKFRIEEGALAAGGMFVYVTNGPDDNVSVIDLSSNTVVATIPVGDAPKAIAVTPDGTTAYVTNLASYDVSVIDVATNTVVGSPIFVGNPPQRIAITPDGTRAYLALDGVPGGVSVIDLTTNTVVATIPVGNGPGSIAITPDGTTVYVGIGGALANDPQFVSVIDVASNAVVGSPIPVTSSPTAIAITPDGTTAYVTQTRSNDVKVIDLATNQVVLSIPTGTSSTRVAITPDGTTAYVVNHFNGVTLIDVASNTVVGSIPVEKNSHGIVITPDGTKAYLVETNFNNVLVIDLATNTVVGSPIPVGTQPIGIAITPGS